MSLSFDDIKKQINNMVYLNVLSFSVLSGCGNCTKLDWPDYELVEEILEGIPSENRPYNIFFTDSLYKKGTPQYIKPSDTPYDFEGFQWVDKRQKKYIDVETLANSIISSCALAEKILTLELQLENPRFMAFLLGRNALRQARFIVKHLMVGDVFYNGEDVTEEHESVLQIQIAPKQPDVTSQLSVLHAFAALEQLSHLCPAYVNLENNEFSSELANHDFICNELANNTKHLSTKKIASNAIHLLGIYKKSSMGNEALNKVIGKCAVEICRRTTAEGEIVKGNESSEGCSFVTMVHCLNFISQLAYMFEYENFSRTADLIYKKLNAHWDGKHKIFKVKDSNKQSFSIKDCAAIISALFSYYSIQKEPDTAHAVTAQIIGFSEICLIKSGLVNAQSSPILQSSLLECSNALKPDKAWAPVFNKSFEYKISKEKYYCDAEAFKADHVLLACSILLNSISN